MLTHMPNLRGAEWLILIVLVLLLFGAKRLPDAARGLGRSLRIFKAETKGLVDDPKPDSDADAPAPAELTADAAPAVTSASPAAPAAESSSPAPQSAPQQGT